MSGVPTIVLDIIPYLGAVALWAWYPAVRRQHADRTILRWTVLLATLAVLRAASSLLHRDASNARAGLIMLLTIAGATMIARRSQLHRPILIGFLVGVTSSAIVTLMQAVDLPTLAPGRFDAQRFPGLTTHTVTVTWQLAIGVVLAAYVFATTEPGRIRLAAAAAGTTCLLALAVCGAQGGLLGLAAAAAAVAPRMLRSSSRRPRLYRRYALALGPILLVGGLLLVAGGRFESLTGLSSDDGLANERARGQLVVDAARTIIEHPVVGVGTSEFQAEFGLIPHTLPFYYGIMAGVVGLVIGGYALWSLVRVLISERARTTPGALVGYALVALMLAHSVPEPSGPFFGMARIPILLIAVLAAEGHSLVGTLRSPCVDTGGRGTSEQAPGRSPPPTPR